MDEALSRELREVLREMDERAAAFDGTQVIYVVGAGSLVLGRITQRATQDLDFIADAGGELLVNIVTERGVHSHEVPAGLVSMPRGWRDRARPLREFESKHARFLVPALVDRLMDKLARGSATDWEDIDAIVRAVECPDSLAAGESAAAVLADPPSSVFDAARFRRSFGRLADLYEAAGRRRPELGR